MESIANTKVKIVVRKGDKTIVKLVKLGDLFSIDETNLAEEMARQAGLYAYFAVQMAHAEATLARAIVSKDEEYAEADEFARNDLADSPGRVTEAMVRSWILQDENYQACAMKEIDAKRNYRLLRAICQALEMRATMLQSLGAHLRHEMDMTGMNIRERQYRAMVNDVKEAITNARATG